MSKTITTPEMEIVLARYFDHRANVIVPNLSWGFEGSHEMDLAVLTRAGCLYEVEIKISLSDLRKDPDKSHGHRSKKVKYLYFAIPEHVLEKGHKHIPHRAGVLVVDENLRVRQHRAPKQNSGYVLDDQQKFKIARLGALRVWPMKDRIQNQKQAIAGMGTEFKALEQDLKYWKALDS